MTWTPTTPELGIQPIQTSSAVQNHDLGYIITARDPTFGAGEFIYLPGVASTVVGSLVTYDLFNLTSALATTVANLSRPLAVAMSANTGTATWGWYQIAGAAVIAKTTVKVNPASVIYRSPAGQVTNVASTGKGINSAISCNTATVASATATLTVLINRPAAEGYVG